MRILLLVISSLILFQCAPKEEKASVKENTATQQVEPNAAEIAEKLLQTNKVVSDHTMTLSTDDLPGGVARKLMGEKSMVLVHNGSVIFNGKSYKKGQGFSMNKGDQFFTANSGVSLSRWDIHQTGKAMTFESVRNIDFPDGITPARVLSVSSSVSSKVGIPDSDQLLGNSMVLKMERYDIKASTILNNAHSHGTSISILESGSISIQGGTHRKSRNDFGESWIYDTPSHVSARDRSVFYTVYILPAKYKGAPVPFSAFNQKSRGSQSVIVEATL